MDILRLRFLGDAIVTIGDSPVSQVRSKKAIALLGYLAVTRRPYSRSVLATLLWGEHSEVNARASLRKVIAALRKSVGSHLLIDNETIAFDLNSPFWMDVAELEAVTVQSAGVERMEEAVTFYRGEFFDGFYVRDAPAFDEWVLTQRARLREAIQRILEALIAHFDAQGEYETAIAYGRRLVDLEPWREDVHRDLMRLLARTGKRGGAETQYALLRRLLDEELGVVPEEATESLMAQIRAGEILPQPASTELSEIAVSKPAFLTENIAPAQAGSLCVAREAELGWLADQLQEAVSSRGQVVFVTGSAGRGKTTLLEEFARRAMDQHPTLLAVGGTSDTYAGVGDPYQPFREVMGMLTGDLESQWLAGGIKLSHARRLWAAAPDGIRTLLAQGRQLLDFLIAPDALLARSAAMDGAAAWLPTLREAVKRERVTTDLEQEHFFEQVVRTLRRLSAEYPLLITLDDLQWADPGSISLLFHLGRRLAGAKIMIACAYRPDEVAASPGDESHPLEKAIHEMRRRFGDVWLDLGDLGEAAGLRLVDAVIESEPNNLDAEFRQALYAHTEGHPLFTVELLRNMQERGDLVQEAGQWVTTPSLSWQRLPARVEAVIAERLNRLEPSLLETLKIASVEGESFSAQIVARVQNINERKLVGRLVQELSQRHRLIREEGVHRIDGRRVFQYRFRHKLFQQHLYAGLGVTERPFLHEEIAKAMEATFGQGIPDLVVQLAYHFEQAGIDEKARSYLLTAGNRARDGYANEEAIELYSRALRLSPESDHKERIMLLLAREQVYNQQGLRELQAADLGALDTLVTTSGSMEQRAEVALRQASYRELTSHYKDAIAQAKTAAGLAAKAGSQELEARAYLAWGMARLRQGRFSSAEKRLDMALDLAKTAGAIGIVGRCYHSLGIVTDEQGDSAAALQYYQQALAAYQETNDQQQVALTLNSVGDVSHKLWKHEEARRSFEQALTIFQDIGNRLGEGFVLNNLGLLLVNVGALEDAQKVYARALEIFRDIEHRLGEGAVLNNLGELASFREDNELARAYCQQALDIMRESGSRYFEAQVLATLAFALSGLERWTQADETFVQTIELLVELEQEENLAESRAGLARVRLAQNKLSEARQLVDATMAFLNRGHDVRSVFAPLRIYLNCYCVLRADGDQGATKLLDEAYALLQERAAAINDEATRLSYLENIPWHRDIVATYESPGQSC